MRRRPTPHPTSRMLNRPHFVKQARHENASPKPRIRRSGRDHPHTAQANLVVAALEDAHVDKSELSVSTTNKVQGREFALTVAWHPFAGLDRCDRVLPSPDRLCIVLSRHLHACIVVGRAGTADILLEHPVSDDLVIGGPEPQVDGVTPHHHILEHLSLHRMPLPA